LIEFVQQLVNGISSGAIYALIALGYTMVYGILKLINFAHGEVFMVGAFAGLAVQRAGVADGPAGLVVSMFAAGLAAAALAFTIERVAYRPLRGKPRVIVLITAIGVSILVQNLVAIATQSAPSFWRPVFVDANETAVYAIEPFLTVADAFVIGGAIGLMGLLQLIVFRTRMGKAMRAVSQNADAAALMGIPVDRVIAFTFVLAGFLAGAGAVLVGQKNGSVSYVMGLLPGLKAFVAAVLGGIGNLPGAVLGGILIGVTRSMSDQYVEARWTNTVVFGILILILVFRPSGLLGARLREKV
jgi:branched-chain amino acid transport system permease protein